ncbi:hypothetical protein HPG69_014779, partial [Diceros bicornis minor]
MVWLAQKLSDGNWLLQEVPLRSSLHTGTTTSASSKTVLFVLPCHDRGICLCAFNTFSANVLEEHILSCNIQQRFSTKVSGQGCSYKDILNYVQVFCNYKASYPNSLLYNGVVEAIEIVRELWLPLQLDASHNDSSISDHSYSKHEKLSLGFGINPFIALVIQTLLFRPERIPSPKEYSVLDVETAFPLRSTYIIYTAKCSKKRQFITD